MNKKSILNAVLASAYITLVVILINLASKIQTTSSSFIVPIIMISLFTLSAAVMGYLFVYQPLRLYLDGKKKDAVSMFLQTVAIFACITLIFFILYFVGVLH